MNKNFKSLVALVVALMMVLCSVALADGTSTITINNAGNITTAHSYEAYQIFSGTLATVSEKQVLSDIVWGEGVDGDALLAALKADGSSLKDTFASATSAQDVADKITESNIVEFSRIIGNNATTVLKAAGKKEATGTEGATGKAQFTGLNDGYYFVKDVTEVEAADGKVDATSAYVIQLIGTATLNIKTDAPKIEKKVKNHDEQVAAYRDANNVGIGDTVDYQITSKVPNMANYKKYYFVVNDTLSKGLTFNASSLVIKVGTKTLESPADYTLSNTTDETTGETKLEIVFKNFIQYETSQKGADIEITYNATVNEQAEVGTTGNPNTVELTYSNNPNKEGKGEDKPGPDDEDVIGKTPKDFTITYVTNLLLKKVDEEGNPLKGVTFEISGYGENAKASYTEEFVKADGGKYWKLKDNTYTTIEPTTLTQGKYATPTTDKYNLVVKKGEDTQTLKYTAKTVRTGEDGIIDIGKELTNAEEDGGLPAGEYIIHEVSTVDGYNVLDHDIIVKITGKIGDNADHAATISNVATTITWDQAVTGGTATVEDGIITVTVENRKGAELPSTGGIGTTIFYVAGSILVLAAAILLITKRRMGSEE